MRTKFSSQNSSLKIRIRVGESDDFGKLAWMVLQTFLPIVNAAIDLLEQIANENRRNVSIGCVVENERGVVELESVQVFEFKKQKSY